MLALADLEYEAGQREGALALELTIDEFDCWDLPDPAASQVLWCLQCYWPGAPDNDQH